MINIDFYLRKRKDLSRLSKQEQQIARLITTIYYSSTKHFTNEMDKEESLPFILYFNLLRKLFYELTSDPFPEQLVTWAYRQLESDPEASAINYSAKIKPFEESFFTTHTLDYVVNFEFERALIWGGLYVLIRQYFESDPEKSDMVCQTMLTCVAHNPYRKACFDPFLRKILKEPIPECPINPDGAEVEEVEESVESRTEKKLAACFHVDGVLEQAINDFYEQPVFIETLSTLLKQAVNKQSGGDPHIQNLLHSKLDVLRNRAQAKREEQQRQSTNTFHHLIIHPEPQKLLTRLHQLIDGQSGAAVGAVLLRAQQMGYLSRVPTKVEYESEFKLIKSWNAIQNYTCNNRQSALAKANTIIIFEGENPFPTSTSRP